MSSSILLFRLYMMFAILLLFLASFFITRNIYLLLKSYLLVFNSINFSHNDIKLILDDNLLNYFVDFYIKRKQFFLCISLMELYIYIFSDNQYLAYTSLAYCYQKNKFFYVAEYYYLKVLYVFPDNLMILKSLVGIYEKLGNSSKVLIAKNRVKELDDNNF